MDFGLRFQVVLHLRKIYKWRELYCFHVRNTYILPFKSELVGCFKGVVVCLSCIWPFLVLFGFF